MRCDEAQARAPARVLPGGYDRAVFGHLVLPPANRQVTTKRLTVNQEAPMTEVQDTGSASWLDSHRVRARCVQGLGILLAAFVKGSRAHAALKSKVIRKWRRKFRR